MSLDDAAAWAKAAGLELRVRDGGFHTDDEQPDRVDVWLDHLGRVAAVEEEP